MITRYPTSDGHELVLINSHMSAYDKGGTSRAQQLALLTKVMSEERAKGNYVIAGGDWNHAILGSLTLYPSDQQVPDWVAELKDSDLPEGFSVVAQTTSPTFLPVAEMTFLTRRTRRTPPQLMAGLSRTTLLQLLETLTHNLPTLITIQFCCLSP